MAFKEEKMPLYAARNKSPKNGGKGGGSSPRLPWRPPRFFFSSSSVDPHIPYIFSLSLLTGCCLALAPAPAS